MHLMSLPMQIIQCNLKSTGMKKIRVLGLAAQHLFIHNPHIVGLKQSDRLITLSIAIKKRRMGG